MHRSYSNEDITILWDSERCRHARRCVEGCPEVFDFGRRPWIDPDAAENSRIWETVGKCPSGALYILYNHGIRIVYDEGGCCSYAFDGEEQIGECDYVERDDSISITHTEVDAAYGGKGIARRLVYSVTEAAERKKKKVVALCSYAAKLLG